ncbi:winged helix-turn-helix domain-containing protein [Mycobacterium sp.]|uniref:winged helix-turn-helix domain-containing protein n=1 Tax=Mycobacterium sp. TaxID=1785 RepID=UPI0031DE2A59
MAEVIEAITGVRYHPGHVWRLLRERGWSRQRPARCAAERDEQAVARWIKQDWPPVQKARGAWIVFQDESGGSLTPVVRATQPGAHNPETLIDFLRQRHTLLGEDATIILFWAFCSGHSALGILLWAFCSGTGCPVTAAAT